MSNITKAILAGIVGAIAIGLLMTLLAVVSGTAGLGSILTASLGGGVATGFIYGGLLGNRKIASASNAERDAALGRQAPPGKGLLYIFREGFAAKLAGLNVSIDGTGVAQLKSPRFTCVVVQPGVHTVTGQFGGVAAAKPGECQVEVAVGAAAAVRIGFNMMSGLALAPADFAALKPQLAAMPMTPADVAEVG